jgi:hypothetical protein
MSEHSLDISDFDPRQNILLQNLTKSEEDLGLETPIISLPQIREKKQ